VSGGEAPAGPAPPGPLALLRRRRDFRTLTAGLTLSYIGSGAAVTALVLHVQSSVGTGVAVGALLLAQALPRLLGPLAGALVDRTELRRLMVACDLGGAALFGLLALLPPLGVILALTALTTLLQAPYSPARSTMIAALVEPDEVATAYAIENTAFNLQVAIGPVIGGVLVAAGGAGLALAIDAATFLVSALLVSRIESTRPAPVADGAGLFAETRRGVAYALANPVARALTISLFLAVAFLALDDVALPFLVRDVLGGGPAAYGVASGAFGIGMLGASLALAFRPGRSPAGVYLGGLATSGAGAIATGLAPGVGAAIAFQAGAGVGNGLENVASNTLIQRHVPPPMLGRVFGLVGTAAYAGQGLAALAGGVYLDLTSPRTVLVTGGLGGLAALALAIRPLARAEGSE
jgi:MFS family permease